MPGWGGELGTVFYPLGTVFYPLGTVFYPLGTVFYPLSVKLESAMTASAVFPTVSLIAL
ncbi:MAG: hypothetical protein AB8B50_20915 [Pirellulaceae bacterium]